MSEITENAARGYLIRAMQLSDLSRDQIRAAMAELEVLLEQMKPEEAEQVFNGSNY